MQENSSLPTQETDDKSGPSLGAMVFTTETEAPKTNVLLAAIMATADTDTFENPLLDALNGRHPGAGCARFSEIMENAHVILPLTDEQKARARSLEVEFQLSLALIEKYGHNRATRDFFALKEAAAADPTPENFSKLTAAGSAQHMEETYEAARGAAKAAVKRKYAEDILPFIAPIFAQVVDEVEEAVAGWVENDFESRSRYTTFTAGPSPLILGIVGGVGAFKQQVAQMSYNGGSPLAFLAQLGRDLTKEA